MVQSVTSEQPSTGAAAERDALASAIERLVHEFDARVKVDAVTSIISPVNADLGVQPAGARAELVERCAPQRISDSVGQQ